MANKIITDLQLRSNVDDDVNFAVDDGIQSYRVTGPQIKAYVAATYISPTVRRFLTGSGTINKMFAFFVSGANATVGATYTNNSITYTVYATVSAANLVYLSGSAPPLASGTLTKASGSGDATIAFSAFRAPVYSEVALYGGGGAGGSGSADGSGGGDTTLGSSFLTAGGGSVGANNGGITGNGGTVSVASPALVVDSMVGGGPGVGDGGAASVHMSGGSGGTIMGGAGVGGVGASGTGGDAEDNSGAGGGGASSTTGFGGCSGGWAGGFIKALLPNPDNTYAFGIGAGGTPGTSNSAGGVGGAGGSGLIVYKDFWQ